MPVPSNLLPLGTRLPWFKLSDLDGIERAASDTQNGQIVIVAFICNHSPYVRHIEGKLGEVLNRYHREGKYVIAISPNDIVSYPSDDVNEMRDQAKRGRFEFPYCIDEAQEVAQAFQAVCTPEFFVYDATGHLAYHGEFDPSRPDATIPVTGASLAHAVSAISAGDTPNTSGPHRSLGCSVKWKSGNQPDYVLAIPDQRWIVEVA